MSALDADNRLGLRKELKKLQKKFKTTMIYITHDQEEAFSLSDRVMVMNNGEIVQIDVPNKIYNHPANDYVKNFVTKHLQEKVSSIEKCTGVDL
jgi:ABC-type Fe3+/spermidine/putrescine transport system ATPase subunit